VLSEVELVLFKCFKHLRLPLQPMTVLSGPNASGKSSIIQALALLHQTMHGHEWSTRLILNGTGVQLGTIGDVVDEVNGQRSFEVGLLDDETSYRWVVNGEREEMSAEVIRVSIAGTSQPLERLRCLLPPNDDGSVDPLANRLRNLAYITAERVGPRELYQLEGQRTPAAVGPRGEHAISLLYAEQSEQVLPGLTVGGVPPTRLRQVTARMQLFFPDFGMSLQRVPRTNSVILGLRTSPETEYYRPVHTGFGVTQTLPIVVAALSASRGDILLIENPEVHLHPRGQALMGQFLAEAANAGVQVIVETHSDHVLNGVRRAVKSGGISAEKVAIHFFRPRIEGEAQVISPLIDEFGRIDSWPDGFFDQFDKDMRFFAGWGA